MPSLTHSKHAVPTRQFWLASLVALGLLDCSTKDNTGEGPATPSGTATSGVAPSSTGAATSAATSGPAGANSTSGTPSSAASSGVSTSGEPTGGNSTSAQPSGAPTTEPSAETSGGGQPNTGGSSGGGGGGAGGQDAAGGGGAGGSTDPVDTCDASAAPAISQLGLEQIVQGDDLQVVVHASQPPGSEDWYLVDAIGVVRVFSGGVLHPTAFLDVTSEVQGSGFGTGTPAGGSANYDERGLLSIAFAPDYETSGKFYVALIPTSGDLTDHDLVLEYTRSEEDPLTADPASRKVILDLEEGGEGYVAGNTFSYAKYHNASTVLFGPDGMLYVGMGDGGGDCNAARPGTPQDIASPYGKILRLDPNAEGPLYAAAGNPFADGGDPRVFHYGLRNPFRFSFDSATGDLYIGEVGQWTNDALYFAPAGATGTNFGWPSFEGTTQNPSQQCASTTTLRSGSTRTSPIFNLTHGSEGGVSNLIVAIVGGSVYRGSAIPSLRGTYLFAEFYPNRPVRALYQCGETTSEITLIDKRCDPNTPDVACFTPVGDAPELRQVGAIVEGNDGELYIPANGNSLLKIVPAP